MPYVNVSETNCLFVAMEEEETRFQKQCEIINRWQSLNLNAHQLIDLPRGFTEKDLKQAKRKTFLHFHPDKNKNSFYSTEAFKILNHAIEFLSYQLGFSIDISTNPFAREKTSKTQPSPSPVSAEKQAYLTQLSALQKSQQITNAQEQFFRNALRAHPEYLSLGIKENFFKEINLFLLVLYREGSSAFFQWLINQRDAAKIIAQYSQDIFFYAVSANRKDCLKILFETYDIKGIHAASVGYSLALCIQLFEEDADLLDTFWFVVNDLNYSPNGSFTIDILYAALDKLSSPTFKKIYETFKHLLLESNQDCSHNSLINKVLECNNFEIKLRKMADLGLMRYVKDPLFQNENKWLSFLSNKKSQAIIQHLQINYRLMKNIGTISPAMFQQLPQESVMTLLNTGLISVDRIMQLSNSTRLNNQSSLCQLMLKKDSTAFYNGLRKLSNMEFTPDFLKSQIGQAHLRLMLNYGVKYSEQQLTTIQATFDEYFTQFAGKRFQYESIEYRLLAQHEEAWLPSLIECISRGPNRMAYLNKVYEHQVKIAIKGFKCIETTFNSFTPLQFFILMKKKAFAVLLLAQGVEWRQNIKASIQTGIKDSLLYEYQPDKIARKFETTINPHYVEKRCIKIILSDPDPEAQKRIIDSKEIIFIQKQHCIEIGFCSANFTYEQRVLTKPHLINIVKNATAVGKITNTEDLDAIEKYIIDQGVYLYSSEHVDSTVLDNIKFGVRITRHPLFNTDTNPCDDEIALKNIQLNEAESYLYKRTLDGDYKTKISFFGLFTLMNFGFSKKEKILAVRALINFLKEGTPIPISCKPALYQGELGRITALKDIVFAPEHPQVNRP